MRRTPKLLLVAAAIGLSACDTNTEIAAPSNAPTVDELRSSITPELFEEIKKYHGMFRPRPPIQTGFRMITAADAEKLALSFIQEYGKYLRDELESEHGRPIDFRALTPVGRTFVSETPYDPLPRQTVNPIRKHWGSYYIVNLGHAEDGVVAVLVSAYATDLTMTRRGPVYSGTEGTRGNEFRWYGIPAGKRGIIISPESAVVAAASTTGGLVRAVPRFIRRSGNYHPSVGFWQIELDRDVMATTPQGFRTFTDVVYVDGTIGTVSIEGSLGADTDVVQNAPIPGLVSHLRSREGMPHSLTPAQFPEGGSHAR